MMNLSGVMDNSTDAAVNVSASKTTEEKEVHVLMTVLLNMLCVLANLVLIATFVRCRRLQTASNIWPVSLSCCYLLLAALVLPAWSLTTLTGHEVIGDVTCDGVAFVTTLAFCESLLALSGIAVDRFLLISYPFRHAQSVTLQRAGSAVLCSWLLSGLLAVGPLAGFGHYTYQPLVLTICALDYRRSVTYGGILISTIVIPSCLIIVVCYLMILRVAHNQARKIYTSIAHTHSQVAVSIAPTVSKASLRPNCVHSKGNIKAQYDTLWESRHELDQTLSQTCPVPAPFGEKSLVPQTCWGSRTHLVMEMEEDSDISAFAKNTKDSEQATDQMNERAQAHVQVQSDLSLRSYSSTESNAFSESTMPTQSTVLSDSTLGTQPPTAFESTSLAPSGSTPGGHPKASSGSILFTASEAQTQVLLDSSLLAQSQNVPESLALAQTNALSQSTTLTQSRVSPNFNTVAQSNALCESTTRLGSGALAGRIIEVRSAHVSETIGPQFDLPAPSSGPLTNPGLSQDRAPVRAIIEPRSDAVSRHATLRVGLGIAHVKTAFPPTDVGGNAVLTRGIPSPSRVASPRPWELGIQQLSSHSNASNGHPGRADVAIAHKNTDPASSHVDLPTRVEAIPPGSPPGVSSDDLDLPASDSWADVNSAKIDPTASDQIISPRETDTERIYHSAIREFRVPAASSTSSVVEDEAKPRISQISDHGFDIENSDLSLGHHARIPSPEGGPGLAPLDDEPILSDKAQLNNKDSEVEIDVRAPCAIPSEDHQLGILTPDIDSRASVRVEGDRPSHGAEDTHLKVKDAWRCQSAHDVSSRMGNVQRKEGGPRKPLQKSKSKLHLFLTNRMQRLRLWNRAAKAVHSSVTTRRAVRTVCTMIGASILCWIPYLVMVVHAAIQGYTPSYNVEFLVTFLAFSNSVTNPLICVLLNRDFRSGLKALFGLQRREIVKMAVAAFSSNLKSRDTHTFARCEERGPSAHVNASELHSGRCNSERSVAANN